MLTEKILDTLIFVNSKIYLHNFHIARVIDTYKYLGIHVPLSDVEEIYLNIEAEFAKKIEKNNGLRIIFSGELPIKYKTELFEITDLGPAVNLQLIYFNPVDLKKHNYKWADRTFWNDLLKHKNNTASDILLVNSQNELIETSRFNIFCYDTATGVATTPLLTTGCLNGVYRRFVLSTGFIGLPELGSVQVKEQNIQYPLAITQTLFVANSVRGVLPVKTT